MHVKMYDVVLIAIVTSSSDGPAVIKSIGESEYTHLVVCISRSVELHCS